MVYKTAKVNVESDPNLNLRDCVLESKFKVLQRIAHGSYAEVFLGQILQEESRPSSFVVIKALNVRLQGDVDAELERTLIDNICFEAEVLGQLNHPNIPKYISAGSSRDNQGRDFLYIIQELVEGQTLAQVCKQHRLSLDKILLFTKQISCTLDYIHHLHILHRDIKPNNIIITPDESTVKIIDFGTARNLVRTSDLITQVGTETYSAPEHLSLASDPSSSLTPSADVYSLAKITYLMLTGSAPTAFRQKRITALPVQVDSEFWSQPVLQILTRATSDLPAERYQSAAEFQKALTDAFEITRVKSRRTSKVDGADNQRFVVDLREQPSWLKVKASQFKRDAARIMRRALQSSGHYALHLGKYAGRRLASVFSSIYQKLKEKVVEELFKRLTFKLIAKIFSLLVLTVLAVILIPYIFEVLNQKLVNLAPSSNTSARASNDYGTAVTDINLRATASGKAAKIGLVPKDSLVKILSTSANGNWCEVEIQQYSRTKENPSFQDRGWVNKSNLLIR